MKILYAHAKNLKIEAGFPGKSPGQRRRNERKLVEKLGSAVPALDKIENPMTAENALLAFVCIEEGDEKIDLLIIKEDIIKARALVGASEIVIGAFAHLSASVASPAVARMLMDELEDMIKIGYEKTRQYPFGLDKALEITIPLHHYNFAFRSFEPR